MGLPGSIIRSKSIFSIRGQLSIAANLNAVTFKLLPPELML